MEGRAPLPEFIYKLFYEKPIYKKNQNKKITLPNTSGGEQFQNSQMQLFLGFFFVRPHSLTFTRSLSIATFCNEVSCFNRMVCVGS
jgi:hypothetical protein